MYSCRRVVMSEVKHVRVVESALLGSWRNLRELCICGGSSPPHTFDRGTSQGYTLAVECLRLRFIVDVNATPDRRGKALVFPLLRTINCKYNLSSHGYAPEVCVGRMAYRFAGHGGCSVHGRRSPMEEVERGGVGGLQAFSREGKKTQFSKIKLFGITRCAGTLDHDCVGRLYRKFCIKSRL